MVSRFTACSTLQGRTAAQSAFLEENEHSQRPKRTAVNPWFCDTGNPSNGQDCKSPSQI